MRPKGFRKSRQCARELGLSLVRNILVIESAIPELCFRKSILRHLVALFERGRD